MRCGIAGAAGACVLGLVALWGPSAVGQDKAPRADSLPPGVVAVINGEEISRKELADELIAILGKPALERMITLKLVEQEARKYDVDVSAEDVDARLNLVIEARAKRWMADGGMKTEAELDQFLQKSRGYSLESAKRQTKAEMRMLVRAELLADKILRKIVTVSPEDVLAEYEKRYGTVVRARQIVLSSRSEADDVLAKLKAGADFELLAKEASIDVATRSRGGEMRPLSSSSQLGKAVAQVQPGGLSEIVRTDDGFHILKVIERLEKKKAKLEDVEAEIRAQILEQRVQERKPSWQTSLLERAQVKVNL